MLRWCLTVRTFGRLAGDFNNLMFSLKESEASIKAMIEFMPSIIIQLDVNGFIVDGNRLAWDFLGQTVNADDKVALALLKPRLAEYVSESPAAKGLAEPYALYRIGSADSKDRIYNIFIFLLKLEHAQSVVVRIDDVTDFERKDEELRQMQKMESVGMLASGMHMISIMFSARFLPLFPL
jgi:PAS domain-containing protein